MQPAASDPGGGKVWLRDGEEMRELTVQLLIQGLDLPRLLDQADLVAVDVVGNLRGAVYGDACEHGRVTFTLSSGQQR